MPLSIGQRLISRLGRPPAILRHQRNPFTGWSLVACAGVIIASLILVPFISTNNASTKNALAAAGCPQGTTLNIVAHQDDDVLFLSPDLLHNIQAGRCVRTVFVTAGDGGNDASYWQSRESGSKAAYAQMSGVANSWTQTDAGVTGHPIPLFTLAGKPTVSLAFMRLTDGNVDGSGFPSNNFSNDNFESLQKLWTGTISTIHAVDGSSSYSKAALTSTLTALMTSFQPDQINTQDYVGNYGDGDHSDHYSAAYFTKAAQQQYTTQHTFTGYQGYITSTFPANVTGADLTAKQNAFYAYAQHDGLVVCKSAPTCVDTGYALWLQRQYTVSSGSGGGNPVANAGANQTVGVNAAVQLDGSGSSDPNNHPLTYSWTQTGGPTVTLSSNTAVKPTFTAPASPTTLTFQLVVNNGQVNSSPDTVTITVGGNQPPVANAGANQTVGVNAAVQLDGSGSSDPNGDPLTYSWTQTGGPSVTLSSSTAVKPTFTAPASVTTLTFQLVVNDGQANSSPATVTITVSNSSDLALLATATASSQNPNTGQTANKAIDGVIDGYPGDYTKEWATAGGGAGSWLKLTWSSPQTVNRIVLYDRPNGNDQITGGNIQFSDGSSVTVGTLPNDDSAYTLTFPAKTITSLQLNITSVSAATINIGLAEIQVYNDSTGGGNQPPVANAGANQTVGVNAAVQLDGSGSSDPNGNPLTYSWTQTGGPSVTLSSSTAVKPTFTAPASVTSLTFQLVVNDGQVNSSPATVTITVSNSSDLALLATATASSQNTSTGQTANKAIDGVIDGYPGDYTKEWATAGGGAGSWLKLTWSSPQTVGRIVLYDRPNGNDQITGGNIQFSDGSSVTVGTLPNNGSAYTLSFPAKTITSLQLTITSMSSSTINIGLAEIQVYGS